MALRWLKAVGEVVLYALDARRDLRRPQWNNHAVHLRGLLRDPGASSGLLLACLLERFRQCAAVAYLPPQYDMTAGL
jgi:hypothetical protein